MDETKIYSLGALFFRLEGRIKSGRWRVRAVSYFFDGTTLSFLTQDYCRAWTEESFRQTFSLANYNVQPTSVGALI